jgi:hypothetical protein
MYYRVAIQVHSSPFWQWKSTALSELAPLFQWLRLYRAIPHDQLRIFSGFSREEMDEQLVRENLGLGSTSVIAAQFLKERLISSQEVGQGTLAQHIHGNEQTKSLAVFTEPSLSESSGEMQILYERGISTLEKRRRELERGTGSDHDVLYQFMLPTARLEVLAWLKLLILVQSGDLQP